MSAQDARREAASLRAKVSKATEDVAEAYETAARGLRIMARGNSAENLTVLLDQIGTATRGLREIVFASEIAEALLKELDR